MMSNCGWRKQKILTTDGSSTSINPSSNFVPAEFVAPMDLFSAIQEIPSDYILVGYFGGCFPDIKTINSQFLEDNFMNSVYHSYKQSESFQLYNSIMAAFFKATKRSYKINQASTGPDRRKIVCVFFMQKNGLQRVPKYFYVGKSFTTLVPSDKNYIKEGVIVSHESMKNTWVSMWLLSFLPKLIHRCSYHDVKSRIQKKEYFNTVDEFVYFWGNSKRFPPSTEPGVTQEIPVAQWLNEIKIAHEKN